VDHPPTVPAERIGDRAKPLAVTTRERIRRDPERLIASPSPSVCCRPASPSRPRCRW
jgi:hypothetical protein